MDGLTSLVEEGLSQGQQEIRFTTSALTLEEIQEINSYLDGYYGTIVQCSSRKNLFSDSTEVVLSCDISDNYYVEEYLMNQSPIPEDQQQASELAVICQEILSDMEEELGQKATDYEKELWIHDYLILHTAYGYPEEEEAEYDEDSQAHESYGALYSHRAVCNGYAFAVKLLCDISGIRCEIITGQGDGVSHAWNLVCLDDAWYHLDVTWDDPSPDQQGHIIYTYFNIDDYRASLGHEWNQQAYPEAKATKDNYYIRNDLYCENYKEFRGKCIEILQDSSVDSFQLLVGDYDGSIYSNRNMDFLFDYTDSLTVNYQSIGEIPYETIYISLK